METIASLQDMQKWAVQTRTDNLEIGFVPTMGYLHEGHLALMRQARRENDRVVTSIFVNPTQFAPHEDLATYPRDPISDSRKCAEVGVDVLFMPEPGDMYGKGFQTYVEVEQVSRPLCGAFRPGHFRGVSTVVLKLFNIVKPSTAYFGEKDFQQLLVIKTMVRDLNLDVKIVPCATVREQDGLAMSSRNSYLSTLERRQALCLYEALQAAQKLFQKNEPDAGKYLDTMRRIISGRPDARPEYVSLVDPETLSDLTQVTDSALAVLAVRIGKTRLIDNMTLSR